MRARPRVRRAHAGLAAVALLACGACDPSGAPPPPPADDAGASPNASILPGPRSDEGPRPPSASVDDAPDADAGPRGMLADSAGRLIMPDAGPPTPMRPDRPLPLDPLAHGEISGVTLKMSLTWRDVPVPPKAPEIAADGIAKAAAATALSLVVDLGEEGRTRVVLDSRAFPLPPRTEIRARDDRLGAVLLWPDGDRYRPIAAGALRTLFGERRVDVTPLSPAQIDKDEKSKPPKVEGLPDSTTARDVHLVSSFGTLVLSLASIAEAGRAGAPLCRIFVELAGMEPTPAICKSTEVPLRASFGWKEGGGFDVEAKSYTRRSDIAPADMAVPPPHAVYTADDLPIVPIGVFLTKNEIAAFRSKAVPVTLAPDAPGEGFFAHNDTDLLQYLLLDGVPVVAVPPHDKRFLVGPQNGTYMAQWRTFLGDHIEPAAPVVLPGVLRIGKREAGDAGP
jgi:hypothetical protein